MADQVAVSILCAPEDHAAVHADIQDIQTQIASPQILGLNIDPLLQPGEFLVETPQGRVHIGLMHQLARLRANLQG
jgi:flagellar biosynthesis/type III secretory pathway protein FliH